jgi:hypothetical protein
MYRMKTKLELHFTNYLLCALTDGNIIFCSENRRRTTSVGVAGDANSSTMTVKQAKKYYKVDSKKFLQDWNLIIHGGATVPFTDIKKL